MSQEEEQFVRLVVLGPEGGHFDADSKGYLKACRTDSCEPLWLKIVAMSPKKGKATNRFRVYLEDRVLTYPKYRSRMALPARLRFDQVDERGTDTRSVFLVTPVKEGKTFGLLPEGYPEGYVLCPDPQRALVIDRDGEGAVLAYYTRKPEAPKPRAPRAQSPKPLRAPKPRPEAREEPEALPSMPLPLASQGKGFEPSKEKKPIDWMKLGAGIGLAVLFLGTMGFVGFKVWQKKREERNKASGEGQKPQAQERAPVRDRDNLLRDFP